MSPEFALDTSGRLSKFSDKDKSRLSKGSPFNDKISVTELQIRTCLLISKQMHPYHGGISDEASV